MGGLVDNRASLASHAFALWRAQTSFCMKMNNLNCFNQNDVIKDVFWALCLSGCDSAKRSISILVTVSVWVLGPFTEPLVFLGRLTCLECSWQHHDEPNRRTERRSLGFCYITTSTHCTAQHKDAHTVYLFMSFCSDSFILKRGINWTVIFRLQMCFYRGSQV